jgi:cytochrome P450
LINSDANLDCWVDGKLLPKGSTILINIWELHHDEKRYANADVFDPDHCAGYTKLASEYLTASDPEARDHYAYGNGRRVCPGMHLGERNIFLGICKLLWAFEFKKAVDENGNLIETDINPNTTYSEGFYRLCQQISLSNHIPI